MSAEVEQMKQLSPEITQEILKWMKAVGDTASEQVPLACQEIIQWGIMSSAIQSGILVVTAVAGACMCLWLIRNWMSFEDNYEPLKLIGVMGSGIVCGLASMGVVSNTMVMLQAIFAPRAYILDVLR